MGQTNMKRQQAGYTLIELILYVGIVGGLLLAVTGFFGISVSSRVKNQSISEVNQQGAYAMDYITQSIRNADSITLPLAAGSGAQLTLVVPTASLSPTIFTLNSGVLQVQEGVAAAVPLTSSKVTISGLTFTNLSRTGTPGIVRVSFTVTRNSTAGTNDYDYSKTFTSSAALRWP